MPRVPVDYFLKFANILNMPTKTNLPVVFIPITIPQIAEGLRKLSKKELETLELLLDKKAMRTIARSREQAKKGKLREL